MAPRRRRLVVLLLILVLVFLLELVILVVVPPTLTYAKPIHAKPTHAKPTHVSFCAVPSAIFIRLQQSRTDESAFCTCILAYRLRHNRRDNAAQVSRPCFVTRAQICTR